MIFKGFLLALLASYATLIRGEESAEPRVAFVCGRPAMHSAGKDQPWVRDNSMGCLTDPVDILNYCRKLYQNMDIRNIVESTESVVIPNWCEKDVSKCSSASISVVPYRCLVGSFQSDALLVPEHCVFDHIHDSANCSTFSSWNKTSAKSCMKRGMVQQSFAMLQPCGIDRFSGVEFVCCPHKQAAEERRIIVTSGRQQQRDNKVTSVENELEDSSAFGRYVQRQGEAAKKWNEHDAFVKAKDDVQKHHHDKVVKMMKDWAAARMRVQDLKATDPQESERLNKEITGRFQKLYEAEEVESSMERKQLKQLHEQRVQADILEKKEQAFDEYANAIRDSPPDAGEILRALKRYVKRLHKDRMHTINHYEHVEETDPEEAESIHQETAEHLKRVDQQLTDALNMLSRLPALKNKLLQQIQVFLDAYHSMDKDVALILLTSPAHNNRANDLKPSEDNKQENEADDEDDEEDDDDDDESFDDETMEDERVIDESDVDQHPIIIQSTRSPTSPAASSEDSGSSEEVAVDYHHLPGYHDEDRHGDAANVERDLYAVNEAYISKAGMKDSISGATVAIIVCSTLALIAMISVGVVMMRRRRHRYSRPLRLNLDPTVGLDDASPEERHVASMQMNGYENPTYKFFEQQNGPSA